MPYNPSLLNVNSYSVPWGALQCTSREWGFSNRSLIAEAHLDHLSGFEVSDAIHTVLFHASSNGEDVRVKNDVITIEPHLLHQQLVGT